MGFDLFGFGDLLRGNSKKNNREEILTDEEKLEQYLHFYCSFTFMELEEVDILFVQI